MSANKRFSAAMKLHKKLREMPLKEVRDWIWARRPSNNAAKIQLEALAWLINDLSQIDYMSRKPQADHPVFQELKRRADAAHDLAMSYRRQIEQMKGKR